jgi:hypothetical protein
MHALLVRTFPARKTTITWKCRDDNSSQKWLNAWLKHEFSLGDSARANLYTHPIEILSACEYFPTHSKMPTGGLEWARPRWSNRCLFSSPIFAVDLRLLAGARCTTPINALSCEARPQSIPQVRIIYKKFALSLSACTDNGPARFIAAKRRSHLILSETQKTVNHDSNCFRTAARKFLPTFMCAHGENTPRWTLTWGYFRPQKLFLNLTAALSELEKQLEHRYVWISELKYTTGGDDARSRRSEFIPSLKTMPNNNTHNMVKERAPHRKIMTDFERRGRLNKYEKRAEKVLTSGCSLTGT